MHELLVVMTRLHWKPLGSDERILFVVRVAASVGGRRRHESAAFGAAPLFCSWSAGPNQTKIWAGRGKIHANVQNVALCWKANRAAHRLTSDRLRSLDATSRFTATPTACVAVNKKTPWPGLNDPHKGD
jgi:hypothetical protein